MNQHKRDVATSISRFEMPECESKKFFAVKHRLAAVEKTDVRLFSDASSKGTESRAGD